MKYQRVYSTYNPGDLAFIKSILEESGIDYYVNGEWSGGVYPVAIGMDVMVIETQAEQAKEIIEDFKKKTTGPQIPE